MEAAQASVNHITELLAATRRAVEPLTTNPQLSQWLQVNFDKAGEQLRLYGLNEDYKSARDQYTAGIKAILRELEKLENELGDLAIDVRRRATKPEAAKLQAARLQQECEGLEQPLRDLEGHCRILIEGQENLRRLLSLPGLLPLAKQATKINPESLEQGLRFYRFVTGENNEAKTPTLDQCAARAGQLEGKLKEIDFSGLPAMATRLLQNLIFTAIKASDQIKAYVEDFQEYQPEEIDQLQDFIRQLEELRAVELPLLLERFPATIGKLGNLLTALAYRGKSLRQLELLPVFLKNIKLFHDTIKPGLLTDLKQRIAGAGSSLNPSYLAAEQATDFFLGLRGMVLTVKMLFQSLAGQRTITTQELQEKTVAILTGCPGHSGKSEAELTKIRIFIDQHLDVYGKPFPYEQLLQFMKRAIAVYGDRLEQFIMDYEVPEPVADQENGSGKATKAMPLSRLTGKLEIWTEHFIVH